MAINNIKNFWETCNENFSHIKISGHLKNYKHLTNSWQKRFLNKLENFIDLKNKVIVDYGIGGAYLGIYLNNKYGIKKYIGIDIAERQLKIAKENLDNNKINYKLLMPPCDFSTLNADCFISQAVIQHFPNVEYLDNFIININNSKIPILMLQIRHGDKTTILDGDYEITKEVCWKCRTNNEYILRLLSNYDNVYKSKIYPNKYQILIYKLNNL